MKRKILFVLMILGLAAMVSAQDGEAGRERRSRQAPEPVTVSGSMVVARGIPALKSGDVTYYVSGINRLIGFVDGLKEGAQVSIEGIVIPFPRNENVKVLHSSKLTVSGKTYDLAPMGMNLHPMMGPGRWGNNQNRSPQGPAPRRNAPQRNDKRKNAPQKNAPQRFQQPKPR